MIQHPLAEPWIELEAAELSAQPQRMTAQRRPAQSARGPNAAKCCAAEAGFRACEMAVMTHGGMGHAGEYHVERYSREGRRMRSDDVHA